MLQRPYGDTGLSVSELSLGTSPLGGGIFYRDDKESIAVLKAAFDAGINYFDTAENYGSGLHEKYLGEVFAKQRDQVIIASKGGLNMKRYGDFLLKVRPVVKPIRKLLRNHRRSIGLIRDNMKYYSYDPVTIRSSLEGTLRRLGSDYIDVYQYFNVTTSDFAKDDLFCLMDKLKAEGKIRVAGATVIKYEEGYPGLKHHGMQSIQVPVSIYDQSCINDFLPAASERSVAVVGRSPLSGGFLVDANPHIKATESSHISSEEINRRIEVANKLRNILPSNLPLHQFSIRYALQVKGVSTVLFSVANREQLSENLKALSAAPLSQELINAANEIAIS